MFDLKKNEKKFIKQTERGNYQAAAGQNPNGQGEAVSGEQLFGCHD